MNTNHTTQADEERSSLCAICNRPVAIYYDARLLDAEVYHNDVYFSFSPRHVMCSPERAQFIRTINMIVTVKDVKNSKWLLAPEVRKDLERRYTEAYQSMGNLGKLLQTLYKKYPSCAPCRS